MAYWSVIAFLVVKHNVLSIITFAVLLGDDIEQKLKVFKNVVHILILIKILKHNPNQT
jgi:hypothetical protein